MSYTFLQQYWWFIVSLLGALLVFLLFVQGANSLVYTLGSTEDGQRKVLESTGRKWEITFTTLVTFGGAFLRYCGRRFLEAESDVETDGVGFQFRFGR